MAVFIHQTFTSEDLGADLSRALQGELERHDPTRKRGKTVTVWKGSPGNHLLARAPREVA